MPLNYVNYSTIFLVSGLIYDADTGKDQANYSLSSQGLTTFFFRAIKSAANLLIFNIEKRASHFLYQMLNIYYCTTQFKVRKYIYEIEGRNLNIFRILIHSVLTLFLFLLKY